MSPFGLIDGLLAPPPSPQKVGWIGRTAFAHRGLHGDGVVENSPSAFAAAIARGLGIECDVQRSADGRAMVFHDWDLDRLTVRTGPVEALTAKSLGEIGLGAGPDRIPTLEQVLEQVDGRVPLLIEVKSLAGKPVVPLCEAVSRALQGYRGHHGVMSFDPRVSRWFARRSPETARGLVVTEQGRKDARGEVRRRLSLWHARPDFLAYDIRDLPSPLARAQRARGLAVATWTARGADDLARAALHADAPIAEGAAMAAL